MGWCGLPFSDHPDTLRDLLAARDCLQRGDCPAQGAQASFGGLHNGSLWPFVLVSLSASGLPVSAIWWLVLATDTATTALLVQVIRRARPQPSQSTLWHAVGATAVVWLLIERTPNTVWSPSLLPWLCALTIAQWSHTGRNIGRSLSGAAIFGGLLALLVDCHPAAWPMAGGCLLTALAASQSVWRAALGLVLGFGAATGVLAPETFLINFAIFQGQSALTGLAAIAAIGLAIFALRRFSVDHHDGLRWPWLLITGASVASLLAGRALNDHPFEVRYWTPPVLTGIVAAGHWLPPPPPRWPIRSAAAAAVLLSLSLAGRGLVSMGNPWPVVEQAAQQLQGAHLAWPATTTRIQGVTCRRLAAAVEVIAPTAPWLPRAPGPEGIQVIEVPTSFDDLPGWTTADRRGARKVWTRTLQLWIDTGTGQACARRDAPGATPQCAPIRPGQWLSATGAPDIRPGAPYHIRAMPESLALPLDPSGTVIVEVEVALHPREAAERHLHVLDLPGAKCPWKIRRLAGVAGTIDPEGRSALVRGPQPAGTLIVSKSWGPGCTPSWTWGASPPCFLELTATDMQLSPLASGGLP